MVACPNKSSKEWQRLVEVLGEQESYKIFLANNEDLPSLSEVEEIIKNYYTTIKDDSTNKIFDSIKSYIEQVRLKVEKSSSSNKGINEKRIIKLQQAYDDAKSAEKIKVFIDNTYNTLVGDKEEKEKGFVNNFDIVVSKLSEGVTIQDKKDNLGKLLTFYNYSNGLGLLNDILGEFNNLSFKELNDAETGSTLWKLKECIKAKDYIRNKYLAVAKELYSDILTPYIPDEVNKEIQKYYDTEKKKLDRNLEKGIITKEKHLKELEGLQRKYLNKQVNKQSLRKAFDAFKDTSWYDKHLSFIQSSDDPVLALTAKLVRNAFDSMEIALQQFGIKASKEFNKFKSINSSSTVDPSEFNKGLYELIEEKYLIDSDIKDELGLIKKKEITKTNYFFTQELDYNTFNKNKYNVLLEADKVYRSTYEKTKSLKKADKERKKVLGKWYSENTEILPDSKLSEIVKQKKADVEKGIITQEELEEWVGENKQLFYQPKRSKYLNSNWLKLYSESGNPKNVKGEYHKYLVDTYLKSQEKLPEHYRKGYKLPSIYKDGLHRIIDDGLVNTVKDKFKESFTIHGSDIDRYVKEDFGHEAKINPVFFTNTIDHTDVSLDLIKSVVLFEKMAKKFETVGSIETEALTALAIVKDRDVIATDSKGREQLSALGKRLGIPEKYITKNENIAAAWLEDFIDTQLYNKQKQIEEISAFGKNIRMDKVADSLMKYTAVVNLGGFEILKPILNSLQGNVSNNIEAWAGKHLNRTSLMKGRHLYNKSLIDIAKDFKSPVKTSLIGQLSDVYDAIQGEFIDKFGQTISHNSAVKLMSGDTWFFGQHAGEHQVQTSFMLAMLYDQKVDQLLPDGQVKKINLVDAYKIDDNGQLTVLEGVDKEWLPGGEKQKALRRKISSINKELHGVYNSFDRASIEKYSWGRLLLFFRKFVVSGFKKRFRYNPKVDYEAGELREGIYINFMSTMIKDWRDVVRYLTYKDHLLTDNQKAALKKTGLELTYMLLLGMLVSILDDDDEEPGYIKAFALYEAYRLQSEMLFYLNPKETLKVLSTPSVTESKIEQTSRFINQLLFTWDSEKLSYERNTGIWKKGNNKSFAYFVKLLGINGYNFNPENALADYKKIL